MFFFLFFWGGGGGLEDVIGRKHSAGVSLLKLIFGGMQPWKQHSQRLAFLKLKLECFVFFAQSGKINASKQTPVKIHPAVGRHMGNVQYALLSSEVLWKSPHCCMLMPQMWKLDKNNMLITYVFPIQLMIHGHEMTPLARKPWWCTWLEGLERWIIFQWAIHTHSESNFCTSINAVKVSCGRAVCCNQILIHVDARDKHTDNFAGWLTALPAFVDSSVLVWSQWMCRWSPPVTVCSCAWTGRTLGKKDAPHMNTMGAATPLLHLLSHVFMIYLHCGNVEKKPSDSDPFDSDEFHLPKLINCTPWFASPLKCCG